MFNTKSSWNPLILFSNLASFLIYFLPFTYILLHFLLLKITCPNDPTWIFFLFTHKHAKFPHGSTVIIHLLLTPILLSDFLSLCIMHLYSEKNKISHLPVILYPCLFNQEHYLIFSHQVNLKATFYLEMLLEIVVKLVGWK